MPLASELVYNDLSGDEIKHILTERFMALLADVPYLQRHITMPRVRMELTITLSCWADQTNPDSQMIEDQVDVVTRSTKVDASPKGQHPDQVREQFELPVAVPVRGPFAHEDEMIPTRVTLPNGATVDRTGNHPRSNPNATVVEQDFGPRSARERITTPAEDGWAHGGGSRDGEWVHRPILPPRE